MLSGQMTILSSPRRAMSPFMDSANSYSWFTACFTSSILLFARGVMRRIRMLPFLTSFFISSRSASSRSGMAFR